MEMPNVLLIVFDTARADVFEPYGAAAGTTPAVAQLAAAGAAHPLAYAPCSWTLPSHAALFSGLLPSAMGIRSASLQRPSLRALMRKAEPRLLPAVLGRAGYHTYGVSANGWVSRPHGFDVGFDEFHQVTSGRYARLGERTLRSRLRWSIDALRANLDDGALEIARILRAAVSARKPFFCFANLVECHSPYLPPKPFNRLGPRDRLRAARDANRYCTLGALWEQALGLTECPPASLDRMQMQYEMSIRQLDAWLARVLDLLDQAGVLEDTQIIVTSDHGENFGEGGLVSHQFSLDDRLIRIPFITAGPVSSSLKFPGVMTLADVPHVLADAVGLRGHPWVERQLYDGVAVAEFVAPFAPEASTGAAARSTLEQLGFDETSAPILFRSFRCATNGRLKLIRDADGESVVDLVTDPLELVPLTTAAVSAGNLHELQQLRASLDSAEAGADADPLLETDSKAVGSVEVDQLESQMRLLGYM